MTITQTITINAPVETVFATFTNLGTAKETLSGIKSLEIIEGSEQMTMGTRWKETRSMMGKDSTEEMWVTAIEQNKSYSVDAESNGTKYRSTFTFSHEGNQTRVEWVFTGTPQTFVSKMMSILGWMFLGSLKKMMHKDLEELKTACEKE